LAKYVINRARHVRTNILWFCWRIKKAQTSIMSTGIGQCMQRPSSLDKTKMKWLFVFTRMTNFPKLRRRKTNF
jgi:hypothetical protein